MYLSKNYLQYLLVDLPSLEPSFLRFWSHDNAQKSCEAIRIARATSISIASGRRIHSLEVSSSENTKTIMKSKI